MCIESLTVDILPGCEGLKKPGGLYKDIYVGSVKDIASVTYDATDKFITAITMKSGKRMIKISGRLAKNSGSEPVTPEGEGNVNLYLQTLALVIYHATQAERNAIQDLFSLDQAFFLAPTRAKQVVAYGLAQDADVFQDFGLKLSEADDPTGLELNDLTAQNATFAGNMLNKSLIFGEDTTYALNLTALEALLTPAA
jgi:hypothetical protein